MKSIVHLTAFQWLNYTVTVSVKTEMHLLIIQYAPLIIRLSKGTDISA